MGPLVHVALTEDQRTCPAKLGGDVRIPAWHRTGEGLRSRGGLHVRGVDVVLEDHRNTVQRPDFPMLVPEFPVQGTRLRQCVRRERDQRVDRRAVILVGLDPGEETTNQLDAGELASRECRVDPGDRGLFYDEAARRGAGRRSECAGRAEEQTGREQRDRKPALHRSAAATSVTALAGPLYIPLNSSLNEPRSQVRKPTSVP